MHHSTMDIHTIHALSFINIQKMQALCRLSNIHLRETLKNGPTALHNLHRACMSCTDLLDYINGCSVFDLLLSVRFTSIKRFDRISLVESIFIISSGFISVNHFSKKISETTGGLYSYQGIS